MIQLTPQQERAKRRIAAWWKTDSPETTLTGYAGTGKSTAIAVIVASLKVRALYVTPTGKAAAALRARTRRDARTIHSVLYVPVSHDEPCIGRDGKQVYNPDGTPAMTKKLTFQLRERPHDDVEDCDVIVVDEMSMVGAREADNLRELGKRIIAVGDPGQLPPVKAKPGFVPKYVDLTDVVRQASESPVLEIATRIRNGQRAGTAGTSGEVREFRRERLAYFAGADRQILCWRHETRWRVNRLVRSMLRRSGVVPQGGEKIVILRNNAMFNVCRGQSYTMKWTDYNDGKVPDVVEACLIDDDSNETTVKMLTGGFVDQEGENRAELRGGDKFVAATWGYAITVHSSQGSEWRDVLVLDSPMMRPRGQRMDSWLYTAVTRATNRVMIARESATL